MDNNIKLSNNVECCGSCKYFEIGSSEVYCNNNKEFKIRTFQKPCDKYEKFNSPNAYLEDILFGGGF